MIRRTLSIAFCITIFTFFATPLANAAPPAPDSSYFTFVKNYIIAFNVIDAYNKRVLGTHIQAPLKQKTQQIASAVSSVSGYILNGVNAYRASLGLPPVQTNAQVCSFAATRAQEISSGFNHNGFYNRVNSHTIPYTQWSHATENIAETSDYKQVVTLWENSPGHAANMRDNTPYVCIMQFGNYFAYEGMRM